jgi:hypothetical protein
MTDRNETPRQFERDMLPVKRDTNWQLNRVDTDIEYVPDAYGIFVYINWDLLTDSVRLDIMKNDVPLQSFAGTANNVRKHTIRWLFDNATWLLTWQHIAYIGYELARCDAERIDYVQD